MKSAWSERDAQAMVDRYAQQGIGPDLALRIYSTRLLGSEPRLVLHGGGNTSIKALTTDLLGEVTEVVCVKASGGDMAAIDETRMPALRLDRSRPCRRRRPSRTRPRSPRPGDRKSTRLNSSHVA